MQWANSADKQSVNNYQFVNATREFESIHTADMADKQQKEKVYYCTQKHTA